jgi:ADP-heptose:LPS heptosyltransferase
MATTWVSAVHFGSSPQLQETRTKVLIVKLDAIGDFFLWLDSAKEFRNIFPEEKYTIVLLGNHLWVPLAKKLAYFDEVLALDRIRFEADMHYRTHLVKSIRATRFRIVVHPTYSRHFLFGDSIVRFSGAPERIGSEGDCSNILPSLKRISDRWYTRLIPATKAPLMELERNAEFLRGLGLPDFRADMPVWPAPPVQCPPLGELAGTDYYILFPGATVPLKQWPVEHFAKVARHLHRETGWTGVVCGGLGESELGDRLLLLAEVPMKNLAGRTSLPELVSAIDGAHLLVGNDTSGIHIAASVSTPSVCILGGGHYGRFLPYRVEVEPRRPLPAVVVHRMECYRCNWQCIYHPAADDPSPCVKNISVDSVWDTVQKAIV